MATKKKTTSKNAKLKKKAKKQAKGLFLLLIVIIILAAGLILAPMIPQLEGSVYHIDIATEQENISFTQGEQINVKVDASFDYLGIINKDLNENVSVVYKDNNGNTIDSIDNNKKGEYEAIYSVTYRSTTKTITVKINVVGSVTYTFMDGDTILDQKTLKEGVALTSQASPNKDGFTFKGWVLEGSEEVINFPYTSADDVILYATWEEKSTTESTKLEFHFIDPTAQYAYAGDAIYIKAGDTDILIDAGPRQGSAAIIEEYIDQYCTDKTLEYVIATHADQDHIAAFVGTKTAPSIFEYYTCQVFIDFPLSDKTTTLYNNYKTKIQEAVSGGMTHYTALQCYNETDGAKRVYEIADGITMEILYNYFYDHNSSDENNYSVCVLITETVNNKKFLLTGDLELKGEEYLVQNNNIGEVDFFKAGHHGSPTSSNECLLEVIKPKYVVFTGVAGKAEYTSDIDRIFPSTFAINRLAKYTKEMYCLGAEINGSYQPLNGTVIVTCEDGTISVRGLNNSTLLKDTEWFNSTVEYYNTTNSNGAVQMLLDSKHPTADGTRKWRTWPEDGTK